MRVSLGVVLLLTIAVTSIVQAHKLEHTSGDLSAGTNPCRCDEVVVKAAKVQKPLFYASPEAINEAAAARAAAGRFSVGAVSGSVASFPRYNNPYASKTFGSSSSSSSGSSSRSSSSIGILGGLLSRSNSLYSPFNTISSVTTSDFDCGCGKKPESLEVRDLLSPNTHGKVVPSFPPIGDLCYPSQPNGKFQVTTKVTPAYPKIKYSPTIPYEVCVKILNGQIDQAGLRELGFATRATSDGFGVFSGLTSGSISGSTSGLGRYISNDVGGTTARYNNLGGYSSLGGYDSTRYNSLAGYGYASSGTSSLNSKVSNLGRYEIYGNSFGGSSNVEMIRGSTGSHKSNCDFGDNAEFPEDYSYPQLPADPVSLALAYKNLFPRTVLYNKRAFVPEDKLAFGHRTVPTESALGRKTPDIPEEKLQILDKPVVELKPMSPIPLTVGIYDEQEEAKLAELEAIERERINQEEIAEQQQGNFITYGDLGYAPINGILSGKLTRLLSVDPVDMLDTEDNIGGPVGPPVPGYIPGSIVTDRELVGSESEDDIQSNIELHVPHYVNDEASDEEDAIDDPTSGIFARLKNAARKYGPPCGAV